MRTKTAIIGADPAGVVMLAQGLERFCKGGVLDGLDFHSAKALARVWKAERFSWRFTLLMHHFRIAL